jgi:hypothetical protein
MPYWYNYSMTIADMRQKCKAALATIPRDLLVILVLVVASTASFGLGYLAGTDAGQGSGAASKAAASPTTTPVVASRTGTKYYLPDCAGATKISESNTVWFASIELARAENYEPADNCPGL